MESAVAGRVIHRVIHRMSTSLLALGIATLALVLALPALWYAFRAARVPLATVKRIEASHADLQEAFSNLVESHKRLRSRVGMRELRERRNEEPESESPADYKARLRARLGLVPGRPAPKVGIP